MRKAVRRFDGIIFDVGDILYDASTWRRWLTTALQNEGVEITYQQLVERWEFLLVDVYRGRASYWDRFATLLESTHLESGRARQLTHAAKQKAEDVQVDRKPMPSVPETLQALRIHGVKLSALSDTESGEHMVRKTLKELEIEDLFSAVVTSADIGYVKPEPRAYLAAAAAMNLHENECAFVGHDIDELEGAQRAGLFAIAYNYHPDAPADVYIDDFHQLSDVVLEKEVENS